MDDQEPEQDEPRAIQRTNIEKGGKFATLYCNKCGMITAHRWAGAMGKRIGITFFGFCFFVGIIMSTGENRIAFSVLLAAMLIIEKLISNAWICKRCGSRTETE